jgi:glycosyltransferase involved in cell wall biosynthesis
MRILFIHTHYKNRGGEDIVVDKEMALVKGAGSDVHFLSFSNSGLTFFKFLLAPFNIFSFIRTWVCIQKFKPDVIHLHNWSFAASPSVIWAASCCDVPVVHTLHNFRIVCPSATLSFQRHPYFGSVKSKFPWQSIRQKVYKNSFISTFWQTVATRFNFFISTWNRISFYIVLTNQQKEIIQESYLGIDPHKIGIKPNFCESANKSGDTCRGDHFLFVGRLSEEKGVHCLLKCFEQNSFHLKIIGDGPLRVKVLEAARKNSNISYLGFKNGSEILSEMQKCSAVIFPSVCIETFGMSIIEAFSVGTPVIASSIGSSLSLVRNNENGLHFSAGKVDDLYDRVRLWSSLSEKSKKEFSGRAKESYLNNYTPEENLHQLVSIYQSVKCKQKK